MHKDFNSAIRLLYVEDNVFQKEMIRKMFLLQSTIRIELHEVGNLKDCLDFCKYCPVDVVIMDLNLPDSLGINTIKVFKEYFQYIPVMILTSNDEIDLMKDAATFGVNEFMVKGTFDENLLSRQVLFCFEKSKLEKRLREKDRRYKFVLENLHEGFLIVNKTGFVTYANEKIAFMLYYSEEEMIGSPFLNFVNPLSQEKSESFLKEYWSGQKSRHDFQLVKKDKTSLSVNISSKTLMDDKGEYNGFTMLVEDLSERKKTEAELSRLATYPNLNPSPIDEIDYTGKILFQNRASLRLFKDLSVLQFDHPWLKGVEKIIEQFKSTDLPQHLRKVCVDDRYYNQYLHYLPETNSIRIYGTDVTALEQVKEDLSEKTLFYQKLMNTTPLPIYYKDLQGHFLGCNQAFERFIGLQKEVILGKTINDLLSKEDAEFQCEKDKELYRENKDQIYQANYHDKSGRSLYLIMHKAVYRDSHDLVAGLIGVIVDITEQKQFEEKIRENEALFRAMVEIPFARICRWKPDTTLTFVNTAYANSFGLSTEALVGKKWMDLVTEEARPNLEEMRLSLVSNPRIHSFEHKDEVQSRVTWTIWTDFPIYDEKGVLIQYQSVGQDITSRKKAEEELKKAYEDLSRIQGQVLQSEKMASIGQLAAGVAHEINNPVGFVMSNISTLREYITSLIQLLNEYEALREQLVKNQQESIRETACNIEESRKKLDIDYILKDISQLISESLDGTKRIKEIVQSLKSFARTDEGQIKEYDINEGIEATLKIVWNELKYKCEVVKDLAPLPPIRCYPGQLNQVFMNMLVNAAQAIEEKGTITISSKHEKSFIVVRISDTGKGISQENLSRVFDPFFTTKETGKGTGLGLSISYGIIQRHKGVIDVESEEGKGTVFSVKIPDTGL